MKLGIVQGRLINSPPGMLQWFPQDDWEAEFYIAASLGIENIELIAERSHNDKNPIWTKEGTDRLLALAKQTGVKIHTLCNDHIVDYSLINDPSVLKQNLELIERGQILGCNKYLLPFFENSELNMDNYESYIKPLNIIANKCKDAGMIVCIETILNAKELIHVMDKLNSQNIKAVFDTGNRVAFGHNLHDDIILLGDRIEHVHIKDKNSENENVVLGTGLVNFTSVFKALEKINFQKSYTFETNRGNNAISTAKYNISVVNYFHDENFSKS
jgi:sugar phosphate isomerase/epimerase